MFTTLVQMFTNAAQRFSSNERGAVIILFAFSLPLLALAVGAGVDLARVNNADAKAQVALDAAVIAATKELTKGTIRESDVDKVANRYFQGNLDALGGNSNLFRVQSVEFNVDAAEKTVNGTLDLILEPTFLKVAGYEQLKATVTSSGVYNPITVEVALVLDVTGSMRGQKIRDLETAALDLVDQLLGERGSILEDRVRISLVPYANGVNVGNSTPEQRDRLEAITGNRNSSPCVVARANVDNKYAFTEDPPVLRAGPAINNTPENNETIFPTFDDYAGNSRTSYCPTNEVMWLTNDAGALRREIRSFRANGWTAGHLGIAWGWYTLSPLWAGSTAVSPDLKNVLPAGSSPLDYTDDPTGRDIEENEALKVMVIMTDGEFNTQFQAGNGRSADQADKLCGKIAGENVRIYSVAFQAPRRAENLLRDCVANEGRFFDANTGDELIKAFREIAEELARIRLSS